MRDQEFPESLERALLRALAEEYAGLSYNLFQGRLRQPLLELSDMVDLGRWIPASRSLQISRKLVMEAPWGVVSEVLRHEMAHQYVDEVLLQRDERPHGKAFQRVCQERGIDPSAAGLPAATETPERVRLLERVKKLLALAQSENQHEAELAMRTARRLMLEHDLERAASGHAGALTFRHLGRPVGRVDEVRRLLGAAVTTGFMVSGIWVKVFVVREARWLTVLEVCGTRENVEVAEYVHAFLEQTLDRLWREYRKARGLRGDRERRSYQAGVLAGFLKKLDTERRAEQRRGLVLARDAEAEEFVRRRHPRTRSVVYGGRARGASFWDGDRAGQQLTVHRGVGDGGAGGPKLLPGH